MLSGDHGFVMKHHCSFSPFLCASWICMAARHDIKQLLCQLHQPLRGKSRSTVPVSSLPQTARSGCYTMHKQERWNSTSRQVWQYAAPEHSCTQISLVSTSRHAQIALCGKPTCSYGKPLLSAHFRQLKRASISATYWGPPHCPPIVSSSWCHHCPNDQDALQLKGVGIELLFAARPACTSQQLHSLHCMLIDMLS